MKIRNGFVSNSSSSSFVLVATKEAHEEAMKLTEHTSKQLLNSNILPQFFKNIKYSKFGNNDIIVIDGGQYDDYGRIGSWDSEDCDIPENIEDWEYYDLIYTIWSQYLDNIPEESKVYVEIYH